MDDLDIPNCIRRNQTLTKDEHVTDEQLPHVMMHTMEVVSAWQRSFSLRDLVWFHSTVSGSMAGFLLCGGRDESVSRNSARD